MNTIVNSISLMAVVLLVLMAFALLNAAFYLLIDFVWSRLCKLLRRKSVLLGLAEILKEMSWFGILGNLMMDGVNMYFYTVFSIVWFIVCRRLSRYVSGIAKDESK